MIKVGRGAAVPVPVLAQFAADVDVLPGGGPRATSKMSQAASYRWSPYMALPQSMTAVRVAPLMRTFRFTRSPWMTCRSCGRPVTSSRSRA
jgi:hypothetical protein